MNYFMGIDPGQKGAWAIIHDDGKFIEAKVWTSTFYDDLEYWADLGNISAALEQVHSMPGQGVKSVFSFGGNYHSWQTFLKMRKIPYELITPVRWMKAVLDSGDRTPEHRWSYAQRHWPSAPLSGPKGAKLYGIADALCLAEYARRIRQ